MRAEISSPSQGAKRPACPPKSWCWSAQVTMSQESKKLERHTAGLVLLPVPNERCSEGSILCPDHIKKVMRNAIIRHAAGGGGKIPTAPRSDLIYRGGR